MVNLAVNATTVVVDVVLYLSLAPENRVVGLAVGQTASYLVGVVVCTTVLARRLPRDPAGHVLRTTSRCLVAAAVPAVVAALVVRLSEGYAGRATAGAAVAAVLGGAVLATGYLAAARRVRVPEVEELLAPVLSRLKPTA
jgi:putative peptidoglycan lipid II flippase